MFPFLLRYMQLTSPFLQLFYPPYQRSGSIPVYKATAINPARTAITPISMRPAAPVDSGIPPVEVPVTPEEDLGPPVAVGTVELLLEPVG